jgi:hypothetical protein
MMDRAMSSQSKKQRSRKLLVFFVLPATLIAISVAVAFFVVNDWFLNPKTPATNPITSNNNTNEVINTINSWEIKTGSWVQTTNGDNPIESDWKKYHKASVSNIDTIYFTHSGAIITKSGDIGYPILNPTSETTGNIKVNFTLDVTYADQEQAKNPLSATKVLELFGDTATCVSTPEQAKADWWTGKGWKATDTTFPDLNIFSKDIAHYGLKQAPSSEKNNYLCKIALNDNVKNKIKEFGKEITIASNIAITPSTTKSEDGSETASLESATSVASITINPSPDYWRISVMSSAMVNKTGGGEISTSCAQSAVYCRGAVGIGNNDDFFRYPPDHALIVSPKTPSSGEPGCPTDQSKCAEFEFNFKHTVTVGNKNTGDDLAKKQLWLYRITNSIYPTQSNSLYEAGGCYSTYGNKNTSEQWRAAVLEAGQTYDIVTGQAGEGTPLCAAQAAMKNDPLRRGAWQSQLYLCFVSSTGYKYGYGETETALESDIANAKNECDEHIKSANTNKTWDIIGNDDILATSNAVIIYDPTAKTK